MQYATENDLYSRLSKLVAHLGYDRKGTCHGLNWHGRRLACWCQYQTKLIKTFWHFPINFDVFIYCCVWKDLCSVKWNTKEINIILNIIMEAQFKFLPRAPRLCRYATVYNYFLDIVRYWSKVVNWS